MIKLITGVTLLIIILLTSYYILVEKENFENGKNNGEENEQQNAEQCGGENDYNNSFANIHSYLKYGDSYSLNYISKVCFSDFLKDPYEFYSKYKEFLSSLGYMSIPVPYNEFHKKILELSFDTSNEAIKHDTGSLINKSNDKSHCALYTNDCNLSFEDPNFYIDKNNYIFSNIEKLAMCHADDDCKLENSMLSTCDNKCNREVNLDEECIDNVVCKQSNNMNDTVDSYISLREEHDCFKKDNSECNSSDICKLSEHYGMSFCEPKCYSLSNDECENYENCYRMDDGCYERSCYDEQGPSAFPTNITNPVSKLNLRNHYCSKNCFIQESGSNKCSYLNTNTCSNEEKCKVNQKFIVPKCVPNNGN